VHLNKSSGSAGPRSDKSKVSNKSKPHKIKQDSNSSPVYNASLENDSQGTRRVSLEETIRKIIQSELKDFLPYIIQQAKKCEPVQIEVLPVSAQDSDEESIDGPMEIDFV
jgi:hypothetical protein